MAGRQHSVLCVHLQSRAQLCSDWKASLVLQTHIYMNTLYIYILIAITVDDFFVSCTAALLTYPCMRVPNLKCDINECALSFGLAAPTNCVCTATHGSLQYMAKNQNVVAASVCRACLVVIICCSFISASNDGNLLAVVLSKILQLVLQENEQMPELANSPDRFPRQVPQTGSPDGHRIHPPSVLTTVPPTQQCPVYA